MNINTNKAYLKTDIEAVITSYNQGSMLLEAVQSICKSNIVTQKGNYYYR